MRHQDLVNKVLLLLSANKIKAWAIQTGTAKSFDGKRVIKFGLEGHSDIAGLIKPSGRALYIEVKIPPDKQREAQINFQKMVEDSGAIYIIITPENFECSLEIIKSKL